MHDASKAAFSIPAATQLHLGHAKREASKVEHHFRRNEGSVVVSRACLHDSSTTMAQLAVNKNISGETVEAKPSEHPNTIELHRGGGARKHAGPLSPCVVEQRQVKHARMAIDGFPVPTASLDHAEEPKQDRSALGREVHQLPSYSSLMTREPDAFT